jgi:copper chaperone CopZ
MKTTTLRIGGMTCISCQNRIEKRLKSTVGVEEATVNFNTGTAAITYNASVVTMKEITETIEKLDSRFWMAKPIPQLRRLPGRR